jgi:VanZ family protein
MHQLSHSLNANWFRGACFAAAAVMVFYIFYAAIPSGEPLFVIVPPWDKVVHFFYYGTIAALLAHGVGLRWLIVPLILVPTIGALDEWNQAGIPGRDSSLFDWLADEAGTVVAVVLYRYLVMQRKGERLKVKVNGND